MNSSRHSGVNCFLADSFSGANLCYAVDAVGESVRVARVTRASSGQFRAEPMSVEEARGFRAGGRKKRSDPIAAGCVPAENSLTLRLSAPFPSIAKAREVLPSLLDVHLPFPVEKCVYQFLDIKRLPDRTVSALAVAARLETVETLLRQHSAIGIDPEFLDHEGLAIWTQSISELPPRSGPRAVLCVSGQRAAIAIGSGGQFLSSHGLRWDAAQRDIDDIVAPIQRFIRAEFESGVPIQWAFCGPAAESDSVRTLHAELSSEWPGQLVIHDEPASFLPRALGARALSRGPLRCNLRGGPLLHPDIASLSRKLALRFAISLLCVGLALCGFSAAWHVMSSNRFDAAKRAVAEQAARIAPGERVPYGMEVQAARRSLDRQAELYEPFLEAFAPSLVSRLADIMKAGERSGVTFNSLSLKKGSLSVSGTADDWDRCEDFARRTRAMNYSVELDRKEAVGEGPIRFDLKGNAGQ